MPARGPVLRSADPRAAGRGDLARHHDAAQRAHQRTPPHEALAHGDRAVRRRHLRLHHDRGPLRDRDACAGQPAHHDPPHPRRRHDRADRLVALAAQAHRRALLHRRGGHHVRLRRDARQGRHQPDPDRRLRVADARLPRGAARRNGHRRVLRPDRLRVRAARPRDRRAHRHRPDRRHPHRPDRPPRGRERTAVGLRRLRDRRGDGGRRGLPAGSAPSSGGQRQPGDPDPAGERDRRRPVPAHRFHPDHRGGVEGVARPARRRRAAARPAPALSRARRGAPVGSLSQGAVAKLVKAAGS
ncbi:hypothetical protein MIPYR_10747 [uncultured Microbacterium sp.]|uniref:Uncharacterized protein n=1 Tax=uncultured Microbacterium sp. TaxID=191216 RepID=A0A1Y5P0T3_9MICO|nr:hypothetical protein MIPYR_10747 [uncultured Microbacterium sp.]